MRVMVVGHSYVSLQNQRKWELIAKMHEDVTVRVITPKKWFDMRHGTGLQMDSPNRQHDNFEVHAIPVTKPGDICHHLYISYDMTMRSWKPDIILIFEGPACRSVLQILFCKKIWTPKSIAVFSTFTNMPDKLEKWKSRLRHNFIYEGLDAAMPATKAAANLLDYYNFKKPTFIVLEPGADEQFYTPNGRSTVRDKYNIHDFVVGYAGALEKTKGVFDLIEALKQTPEPCNLLLVGDGPLRSELEKIGNHMPPSKRVILAGYVEKEQMPEYYRAMDVLVLASRTTPNVKETFGWVIAEAMLCGIPVIGSNAGEIPEVIGDAGLVFPEGDIDTLATYIARLRNDPVLRTRIAESGRKRALEYFSTTVLAKRTYEFFCELLDKRKY